MTDEKARIENNESNEELRQSVLAAVSKLIEQENSENVSQVTAIVTIKSVADLLEGLGSGDVAKVEYALLELGARQESALFKQIGSMTRILHNSLNEFRRSLDVSAVDQNSTNIPDAANKIESVIQMTFEAANKTIENVEQQGQLLGQCRKQVADIRSQLRSGAFDPKHLLIALDQHEAKLAQIEQHNLQVMMNQEYQDLSGQALQKVLKLVTQLETSLVEIIKVFGKPPQDDAEAPAEAAPQPAAKASQDDVDSLLSSFGF